MAIQLRMTAEGFVGAQRRSCYIHECFYNYVTCVCMGVVYIACFMYINERSAMTLIKQNQSVNFSARNWECLLFC